MVLLDRKIWIVVISACLLVLASYMAFSRLEDSIFSRDLAKPRQQSPESSSPVTIRVETDKLVYASGETVEIKIFLVNNGPDTLKIGPVNYRYSIWDSEGEFVFSIIANVRYASEMPFTLPPYGETLLTEDLGWAQKFVKQDGETRITGNVPAGIYAVRVYTDGFVVATEEVSIAIRG